MAQHSTLQPLLGMTLEELSALVEELSMPRFTAKQIAQWLYEKRVTTIDEMTNLSKVNRDKLKKSYEVGRKSPVDVARSVDGTAKYLFDVCGGQMTESVYIPDNGRGGERATLCVSSQAGCKMNCQFCMTGRQGYHGDLTTNEIINQIFSIPESESLTNIVFMGMGEPMDNYESVLKATKILTEKWGLAWSPKRITVSTIGKMAELRRMIEESDVHIAISVHSPYHTERQNLMPIEKAYPIKKVMEMLSNYDFTHQRRLSVEYIMWHNHNDDLQHAKALAELIKDSHARVNLIRFHAIPGSHLQTSDEQSMIEFRDYLNSQGILCTIRKSRGEDIFAACGMLAGKDLK